MLSRSDSINVGAIVPRTAVEGPGERFALWVQGCPLRCEGCCNPHLLEFRPNQWRQVADILQEIEAVTDIEGVTFLGGEPFAQAEALAALARGIRAAGLTVMIFTGFAIESLRKDKLPGASHLLAACDILVDGPYVQAQASQRRRFIGSDNQRIHLLTDRVQHLAEWPPGDHGLELRLTPEGISINGHPREELIALARQLKFASPAEPWQESD